MDNGSQYNVAIVDYGIGNLFSVLKSCEHVGIKAFISSDKKEIEKSDALILPGVGAFGDAMSNLRKLDLVGLIRDYAETGRNILGVCLGMQLLMSESEEFGSQKGIGIFEGGCKKFRSVIINDKKIRVPQIMWNQILPSGDKTNFSDNELLYNIQAGTYMYFVHSYYVVPENGEIIASISNYAGIEYASSIQKDNIYAFQFHPEKSATQGLRIYTNFKDLLNKNVHKH